MVCKPILSDFEPFGCGCRTKKQSLNTLLFLYIRRFGLVIFHDPSEQRSFGFKAIWIIEPTKTQHLKDLVYTGQFLAALLWGIVFITKDFAAQELDFAGVLKKVRL